MKNNNLLDYKPIINSNAIIRFMSDKSAIIEIEHKGFFAFIATSFFKKPKVTKITLDDIGSYIFLLIDGKSSIYEIAQEIKNRFNEKAEPLYPKLIEYLKILINKKIITLKK